MKIIKVIRGGTYIKYPDEYERHNYEELREFLKGSESAIIINGSRKKRKYTDWAKISLVAIFQDDEVMIIPAGDYIGREKDKFFHFKEEDL